MKTTFGKSLLLIALLACLAHAAHRGISRDTLSTWIHQGASFAFLLIDVRDSIELDTTAIISTDTCRPYNLSYRQGVFQQAFSGIPHNAHVVLYCRTGPRSGSAAALLDGAGFLYVDTLIAGFNGWRTWGGSMKNDSLLKSRGDLPAPSMNARTTGIGIRPVFLIPAPFRSSKILSLISAQDHHPEFAISNILGRNLPGSDRLPATLIIMPSQR
jgi:rhodanese-related sulfurtransferase